MKSFFTAAVAFTLIFLASVSQGQVNETQLGRWLKRFPQADTNGDGRLSIDEALAYRKKLQPAKGRNGGAPRTFDVDPGWQEERFPDDSVC